MPVRDEDPNAPLQLQICSLDYSSYVGKIGIGRIRRGRLRPATELLVLNGPDAVPIKAKVNQVLMFEGLERQQVEEAEAGDIVLINGIEEVSIGTTLCDLEHPDALPLLKVDEPTLTMNFLVNASPLAGKEGRFVTSRLRYGALSSAARAVAGSGPTSTRMPAARRMARPPPLTLGKGSRMAATTRPTPEARTTSVQGGVFPWWQHGSRVR